MTEDELIRRITTRGGFLDMYWRIMQDAQKKGEKVTREQAYDSLNELFLEAYGEPAWPSFDAFRKYCERTEKK